MRQGECVFFAAVFCVMALGSGCAGLAESARGVAGVSTKVLEDGRPNAVKKSYPVDYAKCLETVESVLAENKAYVYARKDSGKMIAFYMTETDTTPVGVFFTVQDGPSTEIAVSSPSRYAKQSIADKIFARFDKMQVFSEAPPEPVSGGAAAPEEKK